MATKMERGAFQAQHVVKDREDPIYAQEAANSNEQPQFFPSVSLLHLSTMAVPECQTPTT